MRKLDWAAPLTEGEETGADRITRHVDEAMDKLQLLTELFGTDANLSMCNEGLQYIVDGIAHDLGGIYEDMDREDGRDTATGGEDLSGIPYVEVGYADGSKERMTGPFDLGAVADVARLMGRESADAIPF